MTSRRAERSETAADLTTLQPSKRQRTSTDDMTSARSPRKGGRKQAGAAGTPAAVAAAAGEGPLGRRGLVDRCQYVRLLEQALASLGFEEVAAQLERASGITAQLPQVRVQRTTRGCDLRCRPHLHSWQGSWCPRRVHGAAWDKPATPFAAPAPAGFRAASGGAGGRLGGCHDAGGPAGVAGRPHPAGAGCSRALVSLFCHEPPPLHVRSAAGQECACIVQYSPPALPHHRRPGRRRPSSSF